MVLFEGNGLQCIMNLGKLKGPDKNVADGGKTNCGNVKAGFYCTYRSVFWGT